MFTLKPEVRRFLSEIKEGLATLIERVQLFFKTSLPGIKVEETKAVHDPLRLNLQFFAEPGDPSPPDGFFATLKDAFKANPHLQTEHKTAITHAVGERFKNYDFDVEEARTALSEKKQRDADKAAGIDTESAELKTMKERAAKLEAKTKKLALDSITGDAEQSKLISRLAAEKVAALNLNDSFELDAAAVTGIVEELRGEFPSLFPVKEDAVPVIGGDGVPPVPPIVPPEGNRSSGGTPPTNTPPKPNADVEALVAETFNSLKKNKRI